MALLSAVAYAGRLHTPRLLTTPVLTNLRLLLGLTEPHFLNLSPKSALLLLICVPIILFCTYFLVLVSTPAIYKASLLDPQTWIVPRDDAMRVAAELKVEGAERPLDTTRRQYSNIAAATIKPPPNPTRLGDMWATMRVGETRRSGLQPHCRFKCGLQSTFRWTLPCMTVYILEFLINAGATPLINFDCAHSWRLSIASQYRWLLATARSLFCSSQKRLLGSPFSI